MSDREVSIEIPKPSFTLFDSKRGGLPEVIVVNEALLSFAHREVFPWHLCVTLEAVDLVENSMPSPSESELLFRIGDEIESTVLSTRTSHGAENALFVARSTWDGERELLFQVHDPDLAHAALQELLDSREWSREWSYSMEEDDWKSSTEVFQLFPRAKGTDA